MKVPEAGLIRNPSPVKFKHTIDEIVRQSTMRFNSLVRGKFYRNMRAWTRHLFVISSPRGFLDIEVLSKIGQSLCFRTAATG